MEKTVWVIQRIDSGDFVCRDSYIRPFSSNFSVYRTKKLAENALKERARIHRNKYRVVPMKLIYEGEDND